MAKSSQKKQAGIAASRILEFQMTKRQLPVSVAAFNRFVKKLSKEAGVDAKKAREFLKQFVWFPELV